MVKVIIGIGIPGSGKTTVLKEYAEKYGYDYICPDDIRKEMLGDATEQSKNIEVWDEARRRTKDLLSQEKIIVFDATFTNAEMRKKFLDFVRENGAEKIQGILFDTPLEVAKERNLKRERQIPEHVIEKMESDLRNTKPKIEEGLDAIFTLNEYQELIDVERKSEGEDFRKESERIR